MRKKNYIIFILVSCVSLLGYTQEVRKRVAEKRYDNFEYIKSSEVLLALANKGYQSKEIFEKLGNSFYFNNKMEEAVHWYKELMQLNEAIDPELYFRYAMALKAVQKYEESDQWMKRFAAEKTDDSRGQTFLENLGYLEKIEAIDNKGYTIENLTINTAYSDFGTAIYNGNLIFASSRGGGKNYKWNDQPFLNLYMAEQINDSIYGNVSELQGTTNTKYHESSVAFLPGNEIMYFTRNNYYNKKYRKDDEGINRLKVYRAYSKSNKWDSIMPIHFNNDDYSVAHPTINASGTTMYFASDMPGTKGDADLFMVSINSDGSLGEPINLGETINKEGAETFPYITTKGDLYFASDSHPGLGGLDLFVIRDFENNVKNGNGLVIENLGKPFNSAKDDFAYAEDEEHKIGFFTSNRAGGKGDDDIYKFNIKEEKCIQLVEGVVLDKQTNELLSQATVTLFDGETGAEITKVIVGEDAAFEFELECEKEYLVRGEKERYSSDELRFKTPKEPQKLKLEVELETDEIQIGDDLAELLDIPIIYFDFDKSFIRPDAAYELEKVVAAMKRYPTLKIDVRSHTDCRGSDKYNEALSERRNKSTIKYLIEVGGISADRLTGRGYGEYQLVNECDDGVPCSAAAHQLNRRSEFIVVGK